MKKLNYKMVGLSIISILSLTFTSAMAENDACDCYAPYKEHIVQYADEHNPDNHIITINYDTMQLLNIEPVEGSSNHHADPMGTLSGANYMMLVAKGSYFTTVWDIKSDTFIKKINLPFRPRSSDTYNKKRNLILLNSRDRPAAVLIDAQKLKMVGRAGFNIRCNHYEADPIESNFLLYSNKENFDPNFKCYAPDYGGDQISGHPLWLSANEFIIIDRANRAIHVYKIKKDDDLYSTKLVQTIRTNSSMHQMIPRDKNNPHNKIFFGMTEGNKDLNIAPRVYKFKLKHGKLKITGIAEFEKDKIEGMFGHNLYISPNKKYLYAPVAAHYILGKSITNDRDRKNILQFFNKIKNRSHFSEAFKRFVAWKGISYYQNIFKEFKKQGEVFIIRTKNMKVKKVVEAGYGAGHVAFSKQKHLAIVTNHLDNFVTIIDTKHKKFIKNIPLNFEREGIFNLTQSHMQHVSEDGEYYYNFWTDGGRFFRINLDTLELDGSIYTGGVPIQGNFYKEVNTTCDIPAPDTNDGFGELFEDTPDLNDVSKDMFKSETIYSKRFRKRFRRFHKWFNRDDD